MKDWRELMAAGSERMTYAPISHDEAAALVAGDNPLRAFAGGEPTDGSRWQSLRMLERHTQGRVDGPFTPHWMVRREDGLTVGCIGLLGAPSSEGTVWVGYSVTPTEQGRRLAGEALDWVIDWLALHPRAEILAAHTEPANLASQRVLERAGFDRVPGGSPGRIDYRLRLFGLRIDEQV